MPHLAAQAINGLLQEKSLANPSLLTLDGGEVDNVSGAILDDAKGLYYSALLTFVDAISGISKGYFSWGLVKLYYAAFFSIRSLLASNYISIFYPGSSTPYSLYCVLSGVPRKESGLSHKVVWSILEREFPSNPLIGTIGIQKAHLWLMSLREEANYRNARFPDPQVPRHFSEIDSLGISAAISSYISDRTLLYTFDVDHAALAFPIECLIGAKGALGRAGQALDEADTEHIRDCLVTGGFSPDLLGAI